MQFSLRDVHARKKNFFSVSLKHFLENIKFHFISLVKCINALRKKNKLLRREIFYKKYQIHIKDHQGGLNDGNTVA
jgi:hypothetical protein